MKKKEIVKYSNTLNKIPLKKYTKQDLNFFYSICAKVRDCNNELVELTFDEIAELSNYGDYSHPQRLRKDLQRLREKLLSTHFHYITDTVDRKGNLFSTLDIGLVEDIVRVRVNIDFIDYFNELANQFTIFELEEYVSLDSRYSKNLYRILKQWKSQGYTPKYKIDELKELLGTPNYTPMILMRDIIKPSIEELKEKKVFSKLKCKVKYKEKQRGKPVDYYQFFFEPQKEQLEEPKKEEKTTAKKPKLNNKFNDFSQKQDYDIDELEKQLEEQFLNN